MSLYIFHGHSYHLGLNQLLSFMKCGCVRAPVYVRAFVCERTSFSWSVQNGWLGRSVYLLPVSSLPLLFPYDHHPSHPHVIYHHQPPPPCHLTTVLVFLTLSLHLLKWQGNVHTAPPLLSCCCQATRKMMCCIKTEKDLEDRARDNCFIVFPPLYCCCYLYKAFN